MDERCRDIYTHTRAHTHAYTHTCTLDWNMVVAVCTALASCCCCFCCCCWWCCCFDVVVSAAHSGGVETDDGANSVLWEATDCSKEGRLSATAVTLSVTALSSALFMAGWVATGQVLTANPR